MQRIDIYIGSLFSLLSYDLCYSFWKRSISIGPFDEVVGMINPNFPLIELHRHLDGNVRLETVLDLGRKHNLSLPAWDVEGLRPHIQVMEPQVGVMAFISKMGWFTRVMVDYEACRRIAYENVEGAWQEGIDYIELRFSPLFMAEPYGLDPTGIVEAVVDGVKEGVQDFDIQVNLIGILSRTFGQEIAWKELGALLSRHDDLVAIDLAGDESNFPAELFVEHFRKVKGLGLEVTAHAGEAAGPESIWQTIEVLGASRIGHALSAVGDPELMDFMLEKRIGIESSLTSNVQTSSVPDYASHPIKTFLELGLLATINTDDPGISNIDLAYEYEVAAPAAGLTQEQILQAQKNALAIAFLTGEKKEALLVRS
jgi:adenosine deaminase